MATGSMIAASAKVCRSYAERLTKGIEASKFARKPKGVDANHPAWILGHLSVYPDKLLPLLGRADVAQPVSASLEAMFDLKSECRDDPDGSIYPPMAEIIERYNARHDAVIGLLDETADDVFARPNTMAMQDRFPTVGHITTFMLIGHPMLHLGQLSTWRRCMGMAAAK
ncbi:MAG: DinB family protein [Phycisphaerales bacterium]